MYEKPYSKDTNNMLMKTISAGFLYGHKIKAVFNYFGVARSETHVLEINKTIFDQLVETTNTRKENFKNLFLRKFFPKLRSYSEDVINSMKAYFVREEYYYNSRIIADNEFDEYIYIVVNGTLGLVKSTRRVKHLTDKVDANIKYVLLEKFSNTYLVTS